MTLSVLRPRKELNCASPVRLTIGSPHRADDADRVYDAMAEASNTSTRAIVLKGGDGAELPQAARVQQSSHTPVS